MELNATYDFLMQVRRKEIVIRRKEALRDELVACLGPLYTAGRRPDQDNAAEDRRMEKRQQAGKSARLWPAALLPPEHG